MFGRWAALRRRPAKRSTRAPVSTRSITVFPRRGDNALFVTNTPFVFVSVVDVLRVVIKIVLTAARRIQALFYPITPPRFRYYPLASPHPPLLPPARFPRSSELPASARTARPRSSADVPSLPDYASHTVTAHTSAHRAIPSCSCSPATVTGPGADGRSARTTR